MKKLIYVVACFLLAAPSFALTGISGGVKGGLINGYDQPGLEISNYKTEQMYLIGGQIKISSLPVVDLIASGSFAWKNKKYNFSGSTFELKMHDLSFDASVVYPIEFRVVSPYLGGGVGSHRLGFTHLEPAAFSLTDNKIKVPESTTRIGYHLVGGINITSPFLPFEVVVEFRYNWINTPGKMTTYNCLTAGINYNLP